MIVKLIVTSDLYQIANLHSDIYTIAYSLTTPASPARLAYRYRDAQNYINACMPMKSEIRIVHHSSILALHGCGFASELFGDGVTARRERSRHPRITFQDIKNIVERTLKITPDISVELCYLDSDECVHTIPLQGDGYTITAATVTTPADYAKFIGACGYTQSHFVDNEVHFIRHEFVDIAGRLWIQVCEEKDTVTSSEINNYPERWDTRIIYSQQEQLNG